MEITTLELEGVSGFSEICKALGLETAYSPETPIVVPIVASVLERSVWRNERKFRARATPRNEGDNVTIFDGSKPPEISIKQYAERIFKYANCSASCFVVAYIYIERFIQRRSGSCLTSFNIHRLLITCVMVAAKFLDDKCENNAYYAAVGGVSTEEMNELELELLFSLEFKLQVTTTVFAQYCEYLKREGRVGVETLTDRQRRRERVAEYERYGCRTM